ncbi:hypothetical protein CTEN210_15965 [Chaetoceros tenuissimus]|uniref:Uncharacterized protein n=1 Tax=Chaetoceros tenuissimus TaxID=426638 RepID=A0AAD3DBD6_9STRA|nr:hypothetical protein CTEN210_15965 [Chaetoceros tenuissimus]
MSTPKRIKVSHEADEDMKSSSCCNDMKHIQDLPSDVFQHCLEFVGTGNFTFVAPVSKHFYWNYINLGVEMKNNVIDVDVILQQGKNKKTKANVVATGSIRLATECFLKASSEFQEEVCRQAAVNGRLDILKCAAAFGVDMEKSVFPYRDADATEITIDYFLQLVETVTNGHLEVIQFLHDEGVDLDCEQIICEIGRRGKSSSLHWMASKGIISDREDEVVFYYLLKDREIDILNESYEDFFLNVHQSTFYGCAEGGSIELLNWLLEENNCEWDSSLFSNAAKSGSIPMMELCLQNDCPSPEYVCSSAMENKNQEAALDALKWLRDHNVPWDYRVCAYAAMYGNLKALKWAREKGCPWNMYTFEWAAQYGHIKILEYCFENNCPVRYDRTFYDPFEDDPSFNYTFHEKQEISLKLYKWLHQQAVPWIDEAGLIAAQEGHWKTFKWATENGCPLHEDVLLCAIDECNIPMVEYCLHNLPSTDNTVHFLALNNMNEIHRRRNITDALMINMLQKIHYCGIPWSSDIIACAERLGRSNVANWLRCVGCPH